MASGGGTFDERMDYLESQVGDGDIVAGCIVDQPYAQDQHETLRYAHPRGGRARYLGGPLLEGAFATVQEIAFHVLTESGSDLQSAMCDAADRFAGYVAENAPVGEGNTHLRTSGSPYVMDNGVEIYRRPPVTPRDEDEHV